MNSRTLSLAAEFRPLSRRDRGGAVRQTARHAVSLARRLDASPDPRRNERRRRDLGRRDDLSAEFRFRRSRPRRDRDFLCAVGELEHVVNGKSMILKPGMVGYVKPPDKIRHKTGPAGAKVLVMWVPGAEANKIASRWTKEP